MEIKPTTSKPLSVPWSVVSPPLFWLGVFFFVPLAMIVGISFFSRGDYGELQLPLTLENFKRLIGFGELGFDSLYPAILGRSVLVAAATTALCVLAALPLAFFISRLPGRWKAAALTLVIIPFWTNLLIRTYAWQILLGPDAPLHRLLQAFGLGERPLYPGSIAVMIGMVCDFLPFLTLPLYASVEKIDWSLAEAAADLGANKWNVFRHALLPQISAGLIAGIILVFLPALGQFVIPDLLGGAKTVLLGNIIQQQFSQSRDWPFGSAICVVAMLIVMVGLWLHATKVAGRSEGRS
jgi:spermidine/putrescine transport system permease protein